jgi:hypothetical protein
MSHPISVAIHARRFLRVGAISGIDSEQGFDASNDAADRAANDGPDRPCASVTLIHPMRDAAGNALSLGCHGQSNRCCDDACKQYVELQLHCVTLPVEETLLLIRQ